MHTRVLPLGTNCAKTRRPAPPVSGRPLATGSGQNPGSSPAPAQVPVTYGRPGTSVGTGAGWGPPPASATNSAAIAALVFSIVSVATSFFLAGFVAIVLGHVARSQIRSRSERGSGMAVTALWLGYLSLLVWLLFWLVYLGLSALLIGFAITIGTTMA